jgi:DNA-binding MarR family transcriptional regulator
MTRTAAPRTTADRAEITARLRLDVTRLARQLRQHADTGLSPSQLSTLASIERHGPLTLGALAEHERLAPPSITKVVAKLEADGLIARESDPVDRRIARVSTTAAGARLLEEIRRRKDAWLAERVARLDAEEVRRLAGALDVLEALTAPDSS